MELTIVMPCLNEAETVAICVRKAVQFIADSGISGEVLVADNGSTDGSRQLAADAGARVVPVAERGYGSALMGGILAARGEYVIMGDADDSYDFTNLMPFVEELRKGADLVMGNRFKGGIAPGAMPPLHRYLGTPVLSFFGRLFFRSNIGDFNCGLRGFRRDSAIALGLQATGMEFASEMIVKAALAHQKISEVPTTLAKDGRQPAAAPATPGGTEGARTWWLPAAVQPAQWLFFYPGPRAAGLVVGLGLGGGDLRSARSPSAACHSTWTPLSPARRVPEHRVPGRILFWLFTQVYAGAEGFLPTEPKVQTLLGKLSLERGLLTGLAVGAAGLVGLVFSLTYWQGHSFGHLGTTSTPCG